ncbi:hypothetical protein LEP3755_43030 [Leptolyngbya sp. NIES-3755]|nr:hypothetical protein LEP3755_43030 [Leptolyngbya sp. NIES-3755]
MSELFSQIANFYGGDSLLKATFSDCAFLVSDIGRSLVSGDAIEVKSFDGYINRRRTFEQVSRLDTIVCLSRLSAVLETKLKSLPEKELEVLDRMRQLSIELPKRLENRDL